jgi:ribonuclease P protein component
LKRRLREIARTRLLPGTAPVDIVITTRPSAYRLTFAQLAELGERIRRELDRVAPTLRPPAGSPATPD